MIWPGRILQLVAIVYAVLILRWDVHGRVGTSQAGDSLTNWVVFLTSVEAGYLALTILLLLILRERYLFVEIRQHEARLMDPSEVETWFVEARTLEPRLLSPERPENLETKKENVRQEVDRLEQLGMDGWTEYQILSLEQMLVDFLTVDDLIARAQSVLEELEDYAEDDAYGGYDRKHYGQWAERVSNAIEELPKRRRVDNASSNDNEKPDDILHERDEAAGALRAVLRTLHEQVANYKKNWSEGSIIYRSLMVVCFVSIPILTLMGLFPTLRERVNHAAVGADKLSFLNWAFLALAGSLVGVLLGLRRSDLVEVGNTDGKREVWRAVQGSALGFMSGVIAYALVTSGLVDGPVVPAVSRGNAVDIGLSVLWAVGAGFSFEKVFERLKQSTWQASG